MAHGFLAVDRSVLVVGLIFGVVFAAASFLVANSARQATGRNPWGIHPVIWLVVGFVFGFIGFIVCLVARFTTRPPRSGPDAPYPSVGYGPGPYGQAPYGSPNPYVQSYPQPTYGAPPTPAYGAQPAPAAYPQAGYAPAPGAPMGNPPAEWYADPSGKHQHRYWNGTNWTEHVADNGVAAIDPVPPEAQPTPGAPPVT